MENTFFIGSYMFTKNEGMREQVFIFSGARKGDSSWTLNITMTCSYGYAGGASTFQLDVKPGDVLRLDPRMKAFVVEQGSFKEKTKMRSAASMRIEEVDRDRLRVTFD